MHNSKPYSPSSRQGKRDDDDSDMETALTKEALVYSTRNKNDGTSSEHFKAMNQQSRMTSMRRNELSCDLERALPCASSTRSRERKGAFLRYVNKVVGTGNSTMGLIWPDGQVLAPNYLIIHPTLQHDQSLPCSGEERWRGHAS
jgi:hypothetical protein